MIVLVPVLTRSKAADSTKYFSSPRPMSRSAAGAPKSSSRMVFGVNFKTVKAPPLLPGFPDSVA